MRIWVKQLTLSYNLDMQYLASKIRGTWLLDAKSTDTPLIGVIEQLIINPDNFEIEILGLSAGDKRPVRHYIRTDQVSCDTKSGVMHSNFDAVGVRDDFIRARDAINAHCELLHFRVIDENGKRIGRLEDYSFSIPLFRVERIHVSAPVWRRFRNTQLVIGRSQIIDVDSKKKLIKVKATRVSQRTKATQAVPA